MSKPVKRNRFPVEKINYLEDVKGIYIDDTAYGEIHPMTLQKAEASGVDEYVYVGKLHHGEVKFITGEDLSTTIPEVEGYNHGFTLEGVAQDIFEVEDALDIYSDSENRIFNYTKKGSRLVFRGDSMKDYALFVRFYDNVYGEENNRWAVIFAEER